MRREGIATVYGRHEKGLFYLLALFAAAPILLGYLIGVTTAGALWLLPGLLAVADLVARWAGQPFREVAGVAQRLKDGDLGARPPAPLPGEWQAIAETMASLAERLDSLTRRFDEQVGARTAELNRKADQLRALGQVGRQVAAVLAPDELLPYVVRLMRGTFAYDLVAVIQDDGTHFVLTACAARGVSDPLPPRAFSPGDPGIVSIEEGMKGDGCICETPARLIDRIAAKSQLVAPIRHGHRSLGALIVQSLKENTLDEDDLFTVQTIAGQVAVALENARLLDAERQLREFAVSEERNRLAREIHDTLAQAFMGILMHLRAMPGAVDASAAQTHREQAELLAQEGLQEARRSVWNLRPRSLEEKSFITALSDELKRLQLRSGVVANLEVHGDLRRLPPRHEAGLLRIAQEALHNVAKHAQANTVNVALTIGADTATLVIADDGIGFDSSGGGAAAAAAGGFGLASMAERARGLGGQVTVTSRPRAGCRVEVIVPLGGEAVGESARRR